MKGLGRLILSVLVILVSFTLIAADVLQAVDLKEPLSTILYLIVIPIVIQVYKLYKDKGGVAPSKLVLQGISLLTAFIFTYANGGFVGLGIPAFPVWDGELVIFISGAITFAGEFIAVVGVAWGAQMALYESLLKRLFEIVGFAAEAKVASRKAVGFLA